jgi:XTP/dITP diphosphohydrolase
MHLVLATRNPHKIQEIRAILGRPGVELIGADAFPDAPDVEEDGDTFEANAVKKAVALARVTGLWALADDSGLAVEALDGAPGVTSARYAGEPVDTAANNRKLLAALDGGANRRAAFVCVLALSDPSGAARTVTGRCTGTIASAARGTHGFGYDPLFIPDGYAQTFAEMPSELKNRLSHRAAALQAARRAWADRLG